MGRCVKGRQWGGAKLESMKKLVTEADKRTTLYLGDYWYALMTSQIRKYYGYPLDP